MGMTIDDIKHCLLVMIDCELCEECNLYGTTVTDHCEHDCVDGALHIIDKYQKIQEVMDSRPDDDAKSNSKALGEIEVIMYGNDE